MKRSILFLIWFVSLSVSSKTVIDILFEPAFHMPFKVTLHSLNYCLITTEVYSTKKMSDTIIIANDTLSCEEFMKCKNMVNELFADRLEETSGFDGIFVTVSNGEEQVKYWSPKRKENEFHFSMDIINIALRHTEERGGKRYLRKIKRMYF